MRLPDPIRARDVEAARRSPSALAADLVETMTSGKGKEARDRVRALPGPIAVVVAAYMRDQVEGHDAGRLLRLLSDDVGPREDEDR